MTAVLLDTHHHLDFLPVPARGPFLAAAAERDVAVVAQTLTPSGFVDLAAGFEGAPDPQPLLSLGFHPWQVADGDAVARELVVFAEAVARTRFIGEVGLDFFPGRLDEAPAQRQLHVLETVLCGAMSAATTAAGPVVVSIHAVRAATPLLDLLERLDVREAGVVPVLHRFGGTSDELTRAIRQGAYLSAHPHLLTTKRGHGYLGQVPLDRLLLESDLPEAPLPDAAAVGAADAEAVGTAHAAELATCLRGTLAKLSELRGEDVEPQLAKTQALLYGVS